MNVAHRSRSAGLALVLAALLAACTDNSGMSTGPRPGPDCTSTAPVSLAPLQGITVPAATLPSCLELPADGGFYLVVPQFATASAPVKMFDYALSTDGAGITSNVARALAHAAAGTSRPATVAQRFHDMLRQRERTLARSAGAAAAREAARRGAEASVVAAEVPAQGSTRTFQVLSNLDGSAFATDTGVLRFIGTHILLYVDKNTPAPPNGFTDAQLATLARVFDDELYDVDVATFGQPSDIDGNGHVIVLMTPTVNKLTESNTCRTLGFVAGFFYGLDLIPTQKNSNGAEIFYALAPDPQGTFSCAHSLAEVGRLTSTTFIHEFQHMISFNQHVLLRNGNEEDPWLNEGLSHIAEEQGSRYYEAKYPPPSGRTSPSQIFPDSAEAFITGDLYNSYSFLTKPGGDATDTNTVSNWPGDGTLPERGAAWLFLRWLGDQQDSTVFARLEQTNLTGVANVVNASGQPFADLFGAFALAVYTDSLPGVARDQIPTPYRFTSRNLRELYDALFRANQGGPLAPRPFPIVAPLVDVPSSTSSSMYPGTMEFWRLQMPTSGGAQHLHLTDPTGAPLDAQLSAQVSVFRCPSANACP